MNQDHPGQTSTVPTLAVSVSVAALRMVATDADDGRAWQEIGTDWGDEGQMLSGAVVALRADLATPDDEVTGDGVPAAWAAHIATFDPPTMRALLDRLDIAERTVRRVQTFQHNWFPNGRPHPNPDLVNMDRHLRDALELVEPSTTPPSTLDTRHQE